MDLIAKIKFLKQCLIKLNMWAVKKGNNSNFNSMLTKKIKIPPFFTYKIFLMTKNSLIKKHFLLFYTIKFYSRVKVIIFWPINVRIIYICFKLLGFYKSGERWKTRHSNVSNNPKAITILNFILLSYSHHASILTARMVILGKFCRVLHSLSRYSMLPTITTCFRSW